MSVNGFHRLPNLDEHIASQCNTLFYEQHELVQDAFRSLFRMNSSIERGYHMLKNYQYLYRYLRQMWVGGIKGISWEMFIKQIFTDDIESAIADILSMDISETKAYVKFYLPRIQQILSPEVRAKLVLIGVTFKDHKDIV